MSEPADVGAAPEMSRLVAVAEIAPEGREVAVVADAAELVALARRFDLVSLDRLEADVRLRTTLTGELEVTGHVSADVVQRCVVTLEPVAAPVEDSFALRFSREFDEQDEVLDEAAPLIEPWPGDEVDVGEIVAQHVALALNPYPRAPGAALPDGVGAPEGGSEGPFAALREIRDKLADKG